MRKEFSGTYRGPVAGIGGNDGAELRQGGEKKVHRIQILYR